MLRGQVEQGIGRGGPPGARQAAAAQAAPVRGRRAGIAGWWGEGISTTADPS